MKRISHPAWLSLSQRRWESVCVTAKEILKERWDMYSATHQKHRIVSLLLLQWNKKFCGDVTSPCGLKLIQFFKETSKVKRTSYHSLGTVLRIFSHLVQRFRFSPRMMSSIVWEGKSFLPVCFTSPISHWWASKFWNVENRVLLSDFNAANSVLVPHRKMLKNSHASVRGIQHNPILWVFIICVLVFPSL